jgi:Zn-dependent protease
MKISGITVKFHYSMLLLAAFILWQSATAFATPLTGILAGSIVTVILFSIVLLHEMAHMKAAHYLGYHSADTITLWGLGGMAQIPGLQHAAPKEELIISIAGPLSNLALAIVTYFLAPVLGVDLFSMSSLQTLYLPFIVMYFFWYNVMLGIFNMIPAFPMDGGRVMRSALSMFMSSYRATQISVYIAWGFAGLFVVGGLYLKSILLVLVAAYVAYVSHLEWKAKRRGTYIVYK